MRIKIADLTLKHCSGAFKAHAGVHARLRQGSELTAGVAIELHEHEIPDFDEAAAVARKCAFRGSNSVTKIGSGGAHVVMNFTARSARAGVAHGPEVFLPARKGAKAGRRNILSQPKTLRLFVHT